MRHLTVQLLQKRHPMINKVTYRIIARKEKKTADQTVPICLSAYVNHHKIVIPLSMKVPLRYWDDRHREIKSGCPEAVYWNADIANVKMNVAAIITNANAKNIQLTRENFKAKLLQAVSDADFIEFALAELENRKEITRSTYNQQKSSLNKLKRFRNKIPFSELNRTVVKDYESWLYAEKQQVNTVWAALKTFKTYVNLAILRGIEIQNPFTNFELKRGQGRKVFCTIPDLHKLLAKYDKHEVPENLRSSLLVFLVGCFTSLRISDINSLDRSWIIDGELSFRPLKTIRFNKRISFELPAIALRLLEDLFLIKDAKQIKKDQKINADLKLIAAYCGIQKPISTHVARHTFATTYLTMKGTNPGTVEVLKSVMGHSSINTTMIYVHLVDETKNLQMKNFDNEFK